MSESTEHIVDPITPDLWLELVESRSDSELTTILQDQHAADIAYVLEQLPFDFQQQIFDLLDDAHAGDVIAELDGPERKRLLRGMEDERILQFATDLATDDVTDILGDIDPEDAQQILDKLPARKKFQVSELLGYDEESAGGIMAKETISAPVQATVDDVINHIRKSSASKVDIYNVYLTDQDGKLAGAVSLKALIIAEPETLVKDIMEPDPISVHVGMDQEEVMELFRRYDLASVPVVNDSGKFIGRITHDDVLDVYVDEIEEDLARLTGQEEIDPGERSLFRNMRYRLPWLLLGLFGGIVAALVIARFEGQLAELKSIVFFLPLIAAMGGNAGIQTSSVMVRGLATGEIGDYGLFARLLRESALALLTGLICGLVIFLVSWIWRGDFMLAIVISVSLVFVIIFAAIVGAITPLLLKRAGLDPALATGPFITATNDIAGLFIYLALASLILIHN